MPKIYQYLNYEIFIYTNDHLVNKKLEIHFKKIKGYKPLSNSECKDVAIFVRDYEKQIKEKWDKIMYYNQSVKAGVIKKKL